MEAVEEAQRTLETVHIADEESDEICELAEEGWSSNTVPMEIPRMSWIPGVPQHKAVFGEDRNPVPEVWKRSHH